jgi:NTP pyrophosphatase (non-canonical NTP hydrolase)
MNDDEPIPEHISLEKLQQHIWQMNHDRGFNTTDPANKLVMLMEEVGELAKAIRKRAGMKFTDTTQRKDIEEELADVQIVLLGLASLLDVDMRAAVASKEAKNRGRTWK